MTSNVSELDKLAFELESAKAVEAEAKARRIAIEEQLCEVAGVKTEGSLSASGQYYKVTTSTGFTRTLDVKKWDAIAPQVPETIRNKITRTKLELDVRQLKALLDLDPATYSIVAEAVTTKPRKASVKAVRLESE